MSRPIELVVADAMDLPREARAMLAEALIRSLDNEADAPLSPEWREELLARSRAIAEGRTVMFDVDEVFDYVDEVLREA